MTPTIRTREAAPDYFDGSALKPYRHRLERYIAADEHTSAQREAIRKLRELADTYPATREALDKLRAEGRDRSPVPKKYPCASPEKVHPYIDIQGYDTKNSKRGDHPMKPRLPAQVMQAIEQAKRTHGWNNRRGDV